MSTTATEQMMLDFKREIEKMLDAGFPASNLKEEIDLVVRDRKEGRG